MVVSELTVGVAFLGSGIELLEAGLNPGLSGIAESDRRIEYKIIKVQCLIARILESLLGFYQRIRAGSSLSDDGLSYIIFKTFCKYNLNMRKNPIFVTNFVKFNKNVFRGY